MSSKELIAKAREEEVKNRKIRESTAYLKTISWFHYLGLLRHNKIQPKRHIVTLADALKTGSIEPRVFELLPAIILSLPGALKFTTKDVPDDLAATIKSIKNRTATHNFRGIQPAKFLHWLSAPIIDVARRRLDFRKTPRRSKVKTHSIGGVIKKGRLRLSLTQAELAQQHHLSLRVIRDLEQGKLTASLKITNDILKVFGLSLQASN